MMAYAWVRHHQVHTALQVQPVKHNKTSPFMETKEHLFKKNININLDCQPCNSNNGDATIELSVPLVRFNNPITNLVYIAT